MAAINNITTTTTSFEDIDRDITETHIVPLLDGPSLSKTSSVSSYLRSLCSDNNLWYRISKSTWPFITDPRVENVISTFPSRYRSFYNDSYPSLMITDIYKHLNLSDTSSAPKKVYLIKGAIGQKLISAVDIRYQDKIIYSQVKVTDMCSKNMSSALEIELPAGMSQTIDLTVDEIAEEADKKETFLQLKESLTLNWILIHPELKRAGNFSSIKPVSVKQDWPTNEISVLYVTILPGRDANEIVTCRIHVKLGMCRREVGLHVKEVMLKMKDIYRTCLNGKDFLVVIQRAILEENYVKRKVIIDEEERFRCYKVFKELKKARGEWLEKKGNNRKFSMNLCSFGVLLYFFLLILFSYQVNNTHLREMLF